MPEKFVGVLSAVLVIEKSVGQSLGSSFDRFAAPIVGCVIGILCLIVAPSGYGTVLGLAVSLFVMNFIAVFRKS